MRCMFCGADIPPQWLKAIENNLCPGCGECIYNDATKTLLQELTEAMAKMPNDPQGVAGWLLSNYRFQKVGAAEPVEKFYRKGGYQSGVIDESNLKVDPTYNEFVKRNNVTDLVARSEQLSKLKRNSKFAEFASMIQSAGDPYGDDTVSTLSQEEEKPLSADEQKAYLELKASGIDPFAKTPVGGITDLSQAISPQEISAFLTSGQDAPSHAEKIYLQSEEGRKILQRENYKKLKAQEAVNGVGGGSFRR